MSLLLVATRALAVAFALFSGIAAAQYPARPVRLIVPFPPGGATELGARIVAQSLGQALDQPVVIDTRPGGDGIVAAQATMNAAADGYTLFYATNTAFNWVPATRKSPPYDPVTDFTPVSLVGYFSIFLVAHPALPATSVAELINYARANPGKVNYGTSNSSGQLLGEQFKHLTKLDLVEIPYKGDGPMNVDLLAGRVQVAFVTGGVSLPHAQQGRLRALANMSPVRSRLLPDVPTADEVGLGQMTIRPWAGIFGPARMPQPVVDRLARELRIVLAREEVQEGLAKVAFQASSSSPAELASFLQEQIAVWRASARRLGIEAE